MKILTLIDVFSFKPAGGAGRVMFETARRLDRRGHDVRVVCRRREDLPEEGSVQGVEFRTFKANPDSLFSMLYYCRKYFQSCVREFLEEHQDEDNIVVHSHHPYPHWLVQNLLQDAEVPSCATFHSPWKEEYLIRSCPEEYRSGNLSLIPRTLGDARNYVEGESLSDSERIVVLSSYMKEKVRKFHDQPEDKIFINPGAVDISRFTPVSEKPQSELRKSLKIPEDKFVCLTVRSLTPRTGIDRLIEAMQNPLREEEDLCLYIGGSGPMEQELKQKTESLGISDSVQFVGYIPEEDLNSYYQVSDLFVLPTRELEGFGLVILESLACGTPIIATPIGGIPEVLEPFDDRLLTESAEVEHLRERISWAVQNREELQDIGKRGRKYVEQNFTWTHHVDGVEQMYEEVLN